MNQKHPASLDISQLVSVVVSDALLLGHILSVILNPCSSFVIFIPDYKCQNLEGCNLTDSHNKAIEYCDSSFSVESTFIQLLYFTLKLCLKQDLDAAVERKNIKGSQSRSGLTTALISSAAQAEITPVEFL